MRHAHVASPVKTGAIGLAAGGEEEGRVGGALCSAAQQTGRKLSQLRVFELPVLEGMRVMLSPQVSKAYRPSPSTIQVALGLSPEVAGWHMEL